MLIINISWVCADDPDGVLPHSHYPESYKQWSNAVKGVSVSLDFRMIGTSSLPEMRPYFFSACVRNDSDHTIYSLALGRHQRYRIIDAEGKSATLRPNALFTEQHLPFTITAVPPHQVKILLLDISQDQFNIIGADSLTVQFDFLDKPEPNNSSTQKFSVESLPFKPWPAGPKKTLLSADPVMDNLLAKTAAERAKFDQATTPRDRSTAAESLSTLLIQQGKLSEARALLPDLQGDEDVCNLQIATTYQDLNLDTAQKIKILKDLILRYRARKNELQHYINNIEYQAAHSELFE